MARIVKIKSAMSEFNMINLFVKLLYVVSQKRYICPRCLAAFRKTGRKEEGHLFERAVRGVLIFTKEGRPSVAACRCGYRAIETRETAAQASKQPYVKMCERCGIEPVPKGRKCYCHICVPGSRKEPKNVYEAAYEGMKQGAEAVQQGLGI